MKFLSLLLFGFALACGNGGSNDSASYDFDTAEAKAMQGADYAPGKNGEVVNEQKIIKTANLSFETQDPSETYKNIVQFVNKYNATVQNDNSGKDYGRIFRTMVIRVPAKNLDPFIEGISQGVDYFDQKQILSQDVSEEYIDIEARLKAKLKLENRYLELLKQAKNVSEILEIEKQLSVIREEIESRQGRLQYLQNQVAMSTVTIDFYKTTSETGVTESYGQKIKNAIIGGWNGISMFFIYLIYLWPFLLFGILIFFIIRWLIRRSKKKIRKQMS